MNTKKETSIPIYFDEDLERKIVIEILEHIIDEKAEILYLTVIAKLLTSEQKEKVVVCERWGVEVTYKFKAYVRKFLKALGLKEYTPLLGKQFLGLRGLEVEDVIINYKKIRSDREKA